MIRVLLGIDRREFGGIFGASGKGLLVELVTKRAELGEVEVESWDEVDIEVMVGTVAVAEGSFRSVAPAVRLAGEEGDSLLGDCGSDERREVRGERSQGEEVDEA